jgi:hypothetical protein
LGFPTGLHRWFFNRQRLVHTFVTNLRGPAEPLTFAFEEAPLRKATLLAVHGWHSRIDQVGGDPAERICPSAIRLALWPKGRCPQTPGTVH